MRQPSRTPIVVPAAIVALVLTCAVPASAAPIIIDDEGLQDVQNLAQIAIALHNYHDTQGRFPTDYYDGVTPLLSWRVALLPFLGEQALFDQFDLTRPWNDPVNFALLSQMPAVYRSPASAPGSTDTDYLGGVGATTMFPGTPVTIASVTDGTSNTLFVGEAIGTSIPWAMPGDVTIGACPTLGGNGFSSFIPGAVPFAFVDGSVRFVLEDIDCNALRGLFARNDQSADTSSVVDFVVAPEPAILPLLACGTALLSLRRRRRQRSGLPH